MNDKHNKVRVISLKEAADINKKNVAYFTLTDGTVAVVNKDDKGSSQNYNSQNNLISKYKRNFRDNNPNINKILNNDDYEVYKIKNNNIGISNYKRRNEINNNNQENTNQYNDMQRSNKGQNNISSFSRKYDNTQNLNNSQKQGYSFNRNRYYNTNINQSGNNKYQRQFNNSNINYNNINSYKNRNYGKSNDFESGARPKSQYMVQNLRGLSNNKQNINANTDTNDIGYKYQVLEVIPVKLCDNYNSQIRNFSHPKPQYVQPYINPDIIIQEIKFCNDNKNIDFGRIYTNEFNSQITSSFNDFDNLEEYDEQGDFRNDELYQNVDLKYSDISLEQSRGLLKNKNAKKYVRPFTNVEIKNNNNNNNSGFKQVRNQNSQFKNCNFKESVTSGSNIRKVRY